MYLYKTLDVVSYGCICTRILLAIRITHVLIIWSIHSILIKVYLILSYIIPGYVIRHICKCELIQTKMKQMNKKEREKSLIFTFVGSRKLACRRVMIGLSMIPRGSSFDV